MRFFFNCLQRRTYAKRKFKQWKIGKVKPDFYCDNSANDEDTCKVQCGKCAEAEEFYKNDLWRWV